MSRRIVKMIQRSENKVQFERDKLWEVKYSLYLKDISKEDFEGNVLPCKVIGFIPNIRDFD